jgi:hypothetical protein
MKYFFFSLLLFSAHAFAATSIHCDLRAQSEGPIKPAKIGSVDLPLNGLIIKETPFSYENKDDPEGAKLKAKVTLTVNWEKKEKEILGLWLAVSADSSSNMDKLASRVETRVTLAAKKGNETSIELMPAWAIVYATCSVK